MLWKRILPGVPNEAVLLRITKVDLNIKRSLHQQTFSSCKLFFSYTLYIFLLADKMRNSFFQETILLGFFSNKTFDHAKAIFSFMSSLVGCLTHSDRRKSSIFLIALSRSLEIFTAPFVQFLYLIFKMHNSFLKKLYLFKSSQTIAHKWRSLVINHTMDIVKELGRKLVVTCDVFRVLMTTKPGYKLWHQQTLKYLHV